MTAALLPPSRRAWPAVISPRWRGFVVGLVVLGAAGFASLAIAFHGRHVPASFDDWVLIRLYEHVGPTGARCLLALTNPYLTTVLSVLVGLATLSTRRWGVAIVACAGPALAIVLTELVFKPIVARQLSFYLTANHAARSGYLFIVSHGYTFPSGHETGLASLTCECALFVLRAPLARGIKAVGVGLLALWTLGGALGLVRNYYHFFTDVIGACCVSLACVLGCALLADYLGRRRASGLS